MAYNKTTWTNGVTPINETNLNKIENELQTLEQDNIIVSSTEPVTDRRKVWIQKGKNLLDKNKLQRGAIPSSSTSEVLDYNTKAYTTEWIPCEPSTTYIASGGNRTRWQVKNASGTITLKDTNPMTTESNSKFMRCYCYYDDNDAGINNVNFQIEQNLTATTYEAYIEKKIYIKNSNNIYEEFYTEGNSSDTEWIDISNCLNTTNFTIRSGYIPKMKRIGNVLYFSGEVYISTALSNSNLADVFTKLPYFTSTQQNGTGKTWSQHRLYTMWYENNTIKVSLQDGSIQGQYNGFNLSCLNGIYIR